ncbi:MAG: hypothetical protein GY861_09690 [bacterium]|nr:hypothetical protein [bacterium]
MAKKQKEKPMVTINDKEFNIEDMTDEQQAMLNHINDLDRKIGQSQFNLDQLMFGKNAFVNSLSQSLET